LGSSALVCFMSGNQAGSIMYGLDAVIHTTTNRTLVYPSPDLE
jgi:hypothetical protein